MESLSEHHVNFSSLEQSAVSSAKRGICDPETRKYEYEFFKYFKWNDMVQSEWIVNIVFLTLIPKMKRRTRRNFHDT